MISRQLASKRSALRRHIQSLQLAVSHGRIRASSKDHKFIFLCGGNKAPGELSQRRALVRGFLRRQFPESYVVIAEDFFRFFVEQNSPAKNLLDIEHRLSSFADLIIIILETPSTFAELGAFSSETLREKLFVINDEKFKTAQSFLNLGPIQAINESSGGKNVAWYKMDDNGLYQGDSIGDTFQRLGTAISSIKPDAAPPSKDNLIPHQENLSRWTLAFVHDVIWLSRRTTYKDLVSVLSSVFGKSDFSTLKYNKALLVSLGLVEEHNGLLQSRLRSTILLYDVDLTELQSSLIAYDYKCRGRL